MTVNEQEIHDAAIRSVAWHNGREDAAEAVRAWCRENWPVVAEGQRLDSAIWNSMPETLANVARGEGLAASIRRGTSEFLAKERRNRERGGRRG